MPVPSLTALCQPTSGRCLTAYSAPCCPPCRSGPSAPPCLPAPPPLPAVPAPPPLPAVPAPPPLPALTAATALPLCAAGLDGCSPPAYVLTSEAAAANNSNTFVSPTVSSYTKRGSPEEVALRASEGTVFPPTAAEAEAAAASPDPDSAWLGCIIAPNAIMAGKFVQVRRVFCVYFVGFLVQAGSVWAQQSGPAGAALAAGCWARQQGDLKWTARLRNCQSAGWTVDCVSQPAAGRTFVPLHFTHISPCSPFPAGPAERAVQPGMLPCLPRQGHRHCQCLELL